MSSKVKKYEVTEALMIQLADSTGLTHDGSNDNRLFAEMIHTHSKDFSEEEYDAMEEEINNYSYIGKGFEVYAWNDGSGYKYWNVTTEEDNYIQVTAVIHSADAHSKDIKAAVQKAYNKFVSYSRY